MATPPLPAGYTLQDDTPPLPKGYSLQGGPSAPAPTSGPIGAGRVPMAAVPAGLQGPQARGLASSPGEVASTVGTHALNAIRGPLQVVGKQPQNPGEEIANAAMPGGLAAYRTAIEPSIAPVKQAIQQVRQGQYGNAARSAESAVPIVGPWADQVERDVGQKGAVAGLAGLATDVLAPAVAGKVVGAIPAAADRTARGMLNTTLGSGKADFARKANPARGYLDNNIGPSGSYQSIADKASDAREEVGGKIGDALTQIGAAGKLIPADDVRNAVHPILDSAKADAQAPLVVGEPAVYDQMKASLEPALQAADAKGGFSPKELWDIQHKLNKSLNWRDQSKAGLTGTQEQISGALGGVIKDNVPEIADLNQKYQDLTKLNNRAQMRADTGTQSITNMALKAGTSAAGSLLGHGTPLTAAGGAMAGAALSSIPARTTMATGISGAGRVLQPVTQMAPAAALPATLAAVSRDNSPANPDNTPDQSTDKEVSPVAQSTPTAASITPQPTPDTHTFSTQQWLSGNPGGDPDEARQAATTLGYTVND